MIERLRSVIFTAGPVLIAGLVLLPVFMAIVSGISTDGTESWNHILENRLLPYTSTTLLVLFASGIFMLCIGVSTAWLISVFDFPGRKVFEWALFLPLALPGYVMAYAWGNFASVHGPLQQGLRDLTGLGARDYWFPDIFSPLGLSFVLGSTLYPYVYISARAAFTSQSAGLLEAGRSLGSSGFDLFSRVACPVAIPAISAGLLLALMEAAADYGAADFLGVQTLGVGVIRSWITFGEPVTAARLAFILILLAFSFLLASRAIQGGKGYQQTTTKWISPRRSQVSASIGWACTAFCSLILILCFLVPVGRLIWLFAEHGPGRAPVWPLLQSTIILASVASVIALITALVFVISSQNSSGLRTLSRLSASTGYAAPGAVLGLGALLLLKTTGFALTGSLALGLLVWIYVSRFVAAGVEPIQASQLRIPNSTGLAARSLGSRGFDKLFNIDLPMLKPGLLASALILFIETVKELPATLMLRPFGWDTLAVKAHAYATDERLGEAALPCLLILLAGLAPVVLLSHRLSNAAPSGQTL